MNDEIRMTNDEGNDGLVIRYSSSDIFDQTASCHRRLRKICGLLAAIIFLHATSHADENGDRASVLIAVGAGGEAKYSDAFAKWASAWEHACDAGGAKHLTIGLGTVAPDVTTLPDRDRLKAALDAEPKDGTSELWIVLLGHGTADAKDAKFNMRGDDLAVSELAAWLKPFQRTTIVVCAFSASGAWLKPLAAPDRIVITAAKSGSENNFARMGGYFAEAIGDMGADIDKDGETSLLEAWLTAARKTAEFFKDEGRLATEHSLLDDNGDGLGTPPDWFVGVRVTKKSREGSVPDGLRAAQIHLVRSSEERALSPERRAERDTLERKLSALRERKSSIKEDDYFRELEAVLLKLAKIYHRGT